MLPLRFVPWEEYMVIDDRPAYPMNFFARFRFCGRFERAALERAMSDTVARHPLLSARLQARRRYRFDWVPTGDSRPEVNWTRGPMSDSLPPAEPLDIRKRPGLRLWVHEDGERTDLVVQMHHACCDALGGFQCIEDLILSYALAKGFVNGRTSLRRLAPENLPRRGAYGLTPRKLMSMLPAQTAGVLDLSRLLWRRPAAIMPHAADFDSDALASGYPAIITRRLDVQQTESLRRTALARRVTVNDLVLRDLFLTLADWRAASRAFSGGDWLRVSVPVNLRTLADRRLPAANVVSLVFIDRRARDLTHPQHLLESLSAETQRIKSRNLGLSFILAAHVMRTIPGGYEHMQIKRRCMVTCHLSNVGEPLGRIALPRDEESRVRFGPHVLESIDLAAPVRPMTPASFTLAQYAGRLSITLHYDTRVFSQGQAAALTEAFARRIVASSHEVDMSDPLRAAYDASDPSTETVCAPLVEPAADTIRAGHAPRGVRAEASARSP